MARYDAFLLRIWRSGDKNVEQVAVRLQHLPDGQSARLDSLEGLPAHLRALLAGAPRYPPREEVTPHTGMEEDKLTT